MVRNFLQRVMYGRYGNDGLNMFLVALYIAFYVLAMLTGVELLSSVGLFAIVVALLRMMSRKIDRRRAENEKFMGLVRPVTQWFRLRRTIRQDRDHCYFKCPHCKQRLRVPRGKGRITVTCRSCGASFQEKS